MSLMDLPEQMSFMMEEEERDDTQSLSEDPDSTQSRLILHTDLSEGSYLFPDETAEPQSNSVQATAAIFGLQSDSYTGLHSPCFTSSVPAQRLAPPTNLTGSEQKQESHQ